MRLLIVEKKNSRKFLNNASITRIAVAMDTNSAVALNVKTGSSSI